jgi:hypothetical protein
MHVPHNELLWLLLLLLLLLLQRPFRPSTLGRVRARGRRKRSTVPG